MRGYQDPVLTGGVKRLLATARERAAAGARVRWITLPSLRDHFLFRLAGEGARLGVEVMHFQAAYLDGLAAYDPPPGLIGTGERLALVAEVLYRADLLTAPGVPRLYARAIAELKRFGLSPEAVPELDEETARLARVYAEYERDKGDRLDPDDAAWLAVFRAEAGRLPPGGDALFVAGFFELSPREVRYLTALDGAAEVHLVLPEDPGLGLEPLEVPVGRPRLLRAENPVHELRYVLAEAKADLALKGLDPAEVAIVAPPEKLAEIELLAREYGLPLTNEAYQALTETEDGRRLFEKLALIEHPTGERLFYYTGLEALAREALRLGLAGWEALTRLAEQLGLDGALLELKAELDPGNDPLAWAAAFVEGDPRLRESPFKPVFLQRAREAFLASGGRDFVPWWRGFLESVRARRREAAGVALLTPDAALGRRYKKAYLVYATSGRWRVGEREDYFFPEDVRRAWRELFSPGGPLLPRRMRGRDRHFWRALLGLAEEVTISYPDTENGQPTRPEAGLVAGLAAEPMPRPRPASTLRFRPVRERSETYPTLEPPRSLAELERWDAHGRCGFKAWMDRLRLLEGVTEPWAETGWRAIWRALWRAKREQAEPPPEALAAFHMTPEEWDALGFWRRVPLPYLPVPAVVMGLHMQGARARVYVFTGEAPDDPAAARAVARDHLSEILAAAALSRQSPAEVWVWGLGGRPVKAYDMRMENALIRKLVEKRVERAKALLDAWQVADARPAPGWHCQGCAYADVCRKG